jgi:hypothetical protein
MSTLPAEEEQSVGMVVLNLDNFKHLTHPQWNTHIVNVHPQKLIELDRKQFLLGV